MKVSSILFFLPLSGALAAPALDDCPSLAVDSVAVLVNGSETKVEDPTLTVFDNLPGAKKISARDYGDTWGDSDGSDRRIIHSRGAKLKMFLPNGGVRLYEGPIYSFTPGYPAGWENKKCGHKKCYGGTITWKSGFKKYCGGIKAVQIHSPEELQEIEEYRERKAQREGGNQRRDLTDAGWWMGIPELIELTSDGSPVLGTNQRNALCSMVVAVSAVVYLL